MNVVTEGAMVDLEELRAFGQAANQELYPRIAEGGRIVPVRALAGVYNRRKERNHGQSERAGAEEAGSAAGSWQRPQAQAGSSGSPAHALGHRVGERLRLEELLENYPGTTLLQHSSRFALLSVPTQVLSSLEVPVWLVLDVPLVGPFDPGQADPHIPFVPDVRAWAVFGDGILLRSYHEYPDGSICAYMRGQWILGRDSLHEFVDWCTLWVAKTLHLKIFDTWPGPQHCSPLVMVQRNRPNEYCHCGSSRRWKDCHMTEDRTRTSYALSQEMALGARVYNEELERRGRDHAIASRLGFRRSAL
jgi:hypothetical protein